MWLFFYIFYIYIVFGGFFFFFSLFFSLHLMLAGRQPFGVLRWFQLFLFLAFGVSCLLDWLGKPFFVCHQHLWFALSFFATGISGLFFLSLPQAFVYGLYFTAFSAVGIHVRLFVFALLALVSGYQCISQFLVSCCVLAACQFHPWRFELDVFCKSATL